MVSSTSATSSSNSFRPISTHPMVPAPAGRGVPGPSERRYRRAAGRAFLNHVRTTWRSGMVWRTLRFVIVLAAVVAAVHTLAGHAVAEPAPPQPAPIALSTALDMLESGAATSATLESTPGATTLTLTLNGKDRATALPPSLIERVIEASRQGGVPLRVAQPAAEAASQPAGGGGFDVEAWVQT